MGVIEETNHSDGEFISTVFLRPKTDGTYRMILNLLKFNKSVNYVHFKMESLHLTLQAVAQKSVIAS